MQNVPVKCTYASLLQKGFSVTEILLISFFFFFVFFFFSFSMVIVVSPPASPPVGLFVCLFQFSVCLPASVRLARRNFKIIIHSCLGNAWHVWSYMISFKIKHPYKIKVSKKKPQKESDTNQTERIKNQNRRNVSVHPDIELENLLIFLV